MFLQNWRIKYFITQPIDKWRSDQLTMWWIHFFFCSLFFWENYIWSPCFLFTTELLWWNYFLNDFRLLVGLLRLACLLSASRMYNFWWEIIFNKSLYYFHIVHQPISSLNTFPFLFPLNFSLIISLSLSLLTLEISVILFPSFWLFVVLFCMLWMLVTVNKVTDMACCLTHGIFCQILLVSPMK